MRRRQRSLNRSAALCEDCRKKFLRFSPSRVGGQQVEDPPHFAISLRTRTPSTARIKTFARTTSTSPLACSLSGPRFREILNHLVFAGLYARLAQRFQIRLLPSPPRRNLESH